jgi:hypothetical protein
LLQFLLNICYVTSPWLQEYLRLWSFKVFFVSGMVSHCVLPKNKRLPSKDSIERRLEVFLKTIHRHW